MIMSSILRLLSSSSHTLFLSREQGIAEWPSLAGMLADQEPSILPIENMLGRSLILHFSFTSFHNIIGRTIAYAQHIEFNLPRLLNYSKRLRH